MAQLTNSPLQSVNFDLERRKSYSFNLNLTYKDGGGVDLTGCTVRFIMKDAFSDDDFFDLSNLIVNSVGTITNPTEGKVQFNLQAAELDATGELVYSIVLWSADNYSSVLAKGLVNMLSNNETSSVIRQFSNAVSMNTLDVVLRGKDTISVTANLLDRGPAGSEGPAGPRGLQGVQGPPGAFIVEDIDTSGVLLTLAEGGNITATTDASGVILTTI